MSISTRPTGILSSAPTKESSRRSKSAAVSADAVDRRRRVDQGPESRSASPASENAAADQELVLLIHGTFAGRAEDEGTSWWQQGSPAWQELSKRLPAGARMPERGEVFRWSGDNSARARIQAGHDLLERLLELETTGRGYHLIGHSHGGSVIWRPLRLATLRRKKLDGLKS